MIWLGVATGYCALGDDAFGPSYHSLREANSFAVFVLIYRLAPDFISEFGGIRGQRRQPDSIARARQLCRE